MSRSTCLRCFQLTLFHCKYAYMIHGYDIVFKSQNTFVSVLQLQISYKSHSKEICNKHYANGKMVNTVTILGIRRVRWLISTNTITYFSAVTRSIASTLGRNSSPSKVTPSILSGFLNHPGTHHTPTPSFQLSQID